MRYHLLVIASLSSVVPAAPLPLAAQTATALEAQRADYANWLATAASSPYAAVYHQPLREDLILGPGGRSPLDAAPTATLSQGRQGLQLETESGSRLMPRNRDVRLEDWVLRVSGSGRATTVTVFAPHEGEVNHPGWFPIDPDLIVEGELRRAEDASERRMLGLDGVEVTATLAGTFAGWFAGAPFELTVYRIPIHGTEEVDLSIFFQDGTSGQETYPPGRFVTLQPLGQGRYRLDFNRARNPFCAYNTIFPCPIPWADNVLDVRIEAGELYEESYE